MDLNFKTIGYISASKSDLVTHYELLLGHSPEIVAAARDPKGANGAIEKVTRRKDDWGHVRENYLHLVPFVVFNRTNDWPGLSLRDRFYAAANRFAYRLGFDQEATQESVESAIRAFFAAKWPHYFSEKGIRARRPLEYARCHFDKNDLVLSAQLYYLLEQEKERQGSAEHVQYFLEEVIEKYLRKGIEWELEMQGSKAFARVQEIVEELS